jgi:hypothetical protein
MDDAERRRAELQMLSARFHVPLQRVVRFTGDEPKYRLETAAGAVDLGDVRGLIGQTRLRNSIAAATGIYLPAFSGKVWSKCARLLLRACEDVDRGLDATKEGTLSEWLSRYLDQHPPHACIQEADEGKEPFLDSGDVHIFTTGLKRWLNAQMDERITRNDLTADLRAFGAEPVKFDVEINGKMTSRSVWRLPAKIWSAP